MNKNQLFKIWAATLLPKLVVILSLFALTTNHAQTTTIKGNVTDTSGSLPGVNVIIKGGVKGTLSDYNGEYQITARTTDTLVFSYMGYKTKEVPIASRSVINVDLQEDTTQLKEIVLNAGYYSVKDKERTESISRITAKDIETQPVTNVLATMQGRMAGVNITQSTGLPGGGFAIQIRGLNSIRGTGNDPLYIVNGVPFASQAMGNAELNNGVLQNQANPLNSINPADIESIEILKDADATAIYGSRGANGVVLITTKKGKAGKSRFDVYASSSLGKTTNHMKLLNTEQYLKMRQEAFSNDGITEYPFTDYDVNGTWNQQRYTDWQKALIGNDAMVNSLQLSLSGGSQETQYILSGTLRNETTVFPGDAKYKRAAIHSTVSHQSKDEKLNVRFSMDYSNDKNNLPGADLTRQAYTLAPNAPALFNADGSLNWEEGTFENPLSYLIGTYQTDTQNLISNTFISYKLGYGLDFKSSFGFTDTRLSEIRIRPSTMYNPVYEVTSADSQFIVNDGKRKSWIFEPQISWSGSWNKATCNVLLGTTFQNLKQESLAVDGYGFPNNAVIKNLLAATYLTILDNSSSEYRYNAAFGRFNLNWDGKYIVNLTARRDGSSRFGNNKRFANFGAIGAAWIFSQEKFLENNEVISFGKIRGSFGTTGNDQIGDYQFLDTYSVTSNIYDGITGMAPSRLFNPNFGWETNKKIEAALELGFFEDRVFLTSAYFRNVSGNQLVGVPLPGTTGFTTIQANLEATVENKGFEFDFRSVNIKSKNFNWTTSLNISLLRNKLLKFPGLEGSTYRNNFVIGESLNIGKMYQLTGIDSETGLYTFYDFNDDGAITSNEDRQIIFDKTPKYFGGLSNNLSYKNWSLDFLFQFVKQKGQDVLATFPITGAFSNQPTSVLNSFPQNGATIQQYTSGNNPQAINAFSNFTRSDAMITDASFIRLKTIALTYRLPSVIKGGSANIYFQGQNLITFTKYKGPDPENQSGVSLPPLRQLTLGMQLSF
ncbi:TonB-dependent Receptor Plug Domain protein [Mariniflexile rhizosphaerae]|uniref:SusC/RagA family TonB-linked outer membrane protein n=1 Tax=unclassified Mariniflexile TaxID=2643887 RepID=UPI000E3314CC|nr:SusC/RagA family TonB-linked outer membrane protein [Mariniflexile sp. TRM1-10]AXP82740.1 TonB-dependent Receptor Plug Domain protein [Mariniflexile sp. TRM1-10]